MGERLDSVLCMVYPSGNWEETLIFPIHSWCRFKCCHLRIKTWKWEGVWIIKFLMMAIQFRSLLDCASRTSRKGVLYWWKGGGCRNRTSYKLHDQSRVLPLRSKVVQRKSTLFFWRMCWTGYLSTPNCYYHTTLSLSQQTLLCGWRWHSRWSDTSPWVIRFADDSCARNRAPDGSSPPSTWSASRPLYRRHSSGPFKRSRILWLISPKRSSCQVTLETTRPTKLAIIGSLASPL